MEKFQHGQDRGHRDPHGALGPVGRALGRLVGRRAKWVVVVLAVLVSGAAFAFAGEGRASTGSSTLPASAESARAAAASDALPSSGVAPVFLVVSRDDGALSESDLAAVGRAQGRAVEAAGKLDAVPRAGERPGDSGGPGGGSASGKPQVSDNGRTALTVVPISADLSQSRTGEVVDAVRDAVRDGLPEGLSANLTGGPAFSADIGHVFDGADFRLLGATAGVVALLLLITYRSPWLWLVPLGVVGTADQVAAKAVDALSRATSVSADGAVTGITSVLVFGAGTNYALLLIARYREELRRTEDRHDAMRRALEAAAPAILASSGTVILALLSLGLAKDSFVTSLGYAGALGVFVALAYALLVLPATLVLFGRTLFWPFVPRFGTDDPSHAGAWKRVGTAVTRRPALVALGSVVALAVLTLGGTGLQVGQSPNEQFLDKPEAVVGQEQLAKAFPAGSSQPTRVVAPTGKAEQVRSTLESTDGVSSVRAGGADASRTAYDVVLAAEPGTDAAFDTVRALRSQLRGTGALVGGADAELLDSSTVAARDRAVLFPVILGIVLVVLLLLLRSVVAAVVLVATVLGTYVASMGASWFAFDHLLGFPPLADSTPLLAFLFLVALGVDYNIFLTTRAREEAATGAGARTSVVTALAVTGGVITSAGILLASVFAVLGVLPLVQLAQIGVIVGFGVLLDTLLVRSVLVPALVSLLGERFWWPGHPAGRREPAPAVEPAGAVSG